MWWLLPALAADWNMPGDFASLEEASDSPLVMSGDRILVAAGVYQGADAADHDFVSGKTLTVHGAGIGDTILLPVGNFTVMIRAGSHIILEDLTVDGAGLSRGVQVMENSSATLRRVEVINGTSPYGAGIGVVGGSTMSIEDVVVKDCSSDSGGGITVNDSELTAVGLQIIDNQSTGSGGGLIVNATSTVVLDDVVFRGNSASAAGGALYSDGDVTLSAATFETNSAVTGAGAVLHGAFAISGATFRENTASGTGGAFSGTGSGSLEGVRFLENQATDVGGAGVILGGDWALRNIYACGNNADQAGFLTSTAASFTLDNALLLTNPASATDSGSLILNTPSAVTHLTAWDVFAPRSIVLQEGTVAASFIGETLDLDQAAIHSDTPLLVTAPDTVVWNMTSVVPVPDEDLALVFDASSCDAAFHAIPTQAFVDVSSTTTDQDGTPGDRGHLGGPFFDVDFWEADLDGDGVIGALDCDDADPNVFPGAPDICDGLDADCDGVEEVVATWFFDQDGDGFGTGALTETGCVEPPGFVDNDFDCDDGDIDLSPDAEERCNGIDDDCDGLIDTEDSSLVDAVSLFLDNDGDGFGGDPIVACPGATGTVVVDGDCNDENPDIHPGAPEVCPDALDNDCDGGVDAADPDYVPEATYWEDGDGDGFGDPTLETTTCDPPSPGVVVPGVPDCNDSDDTVSPGAPEVPDDGIDNDCMNGDALVADADGDGVPDGIDPEPNSTGDLVTTGAPEPIVGCGCGNANDPALWSGALALFLALGRRRRGTTSPPACPTPDLDGGFP